PAAGMCGASKRNASLPALGSFKRLLGRAFSATAPHLRNADSHTDDTRPESEEGEDARADRIRVGIRPQSDGRGGDDDEQRSGAEDEQAESHSDQPGLQVLSHGGSVL